MFREDVRHLIWVYFLISLGGLLLHVRIHPPSASAFNWVAAAFGAVNAFLLPFLFNSRKTVAWAYLMAWATVATGTVAMAYYSVTSWELPITASNIILKTTLPDILILMAKLPLAYRILRIHRPEGLSIERKGCAK
jgi:hypothetical protein